MILMSKVFQRLLNSFDAIFRRETSTDPLRDPLQPKSPKRISRQVVVCFPFIGRNTFLTFGQQPNRSRFCFKSVELEVSLKIISFKRPFRLPIWNFGRLRVNCRRPLGSSLDCWSKFKAVLNPRGYSLKWPIWGGSTQKEYHFQTSSIWEGWNFSCWSIWKGREHHFGW